MHLASRRALPLAVVIPWLETREHTMSQLRGFFANVVGAASGVHGTDAGDKASNSLEGGVAVLDKPPVPLLAASTISMAGHKPPPPPDPEKEMVEKMREELATTRKDLVTVEAAERAALEELNRFRRSAGDVVAARGRPRPPPNDTAAIRQALREINDDEARLHLQQIEELEGNWARTNNERNRLKEAEGAQSAALKKKLDRMRKDGTSSGGGGTVKPAINKDKDDADRDSQHDREERRRKKKKKAAQRRRDKK
jgi:hypothetical protein